MVILGVSVFKLDEILYMDLNNVEPPEGFNIIKTGKVVKGDVVLSISNHKQFEQFQPEFVWKPATNAVGESCNVYAGVARKREHRTEK